MFKITRGNILKTLQSTRKSIYLTTRLLFVLTVINTRVMSIPSAVMIELIISHLDFCSFFLLCDNFITIKYNVRGTMS